MKKLSILVAFSFVAFFTYGQTKKGNIHAQGGGSIGFGTQTQGSGGSDFEDGYFRVALMPTAGVFIADGIVVGGMVEFDFGKLTDKLDNTNYDVNSLWMVGPYGRYYHHSDWFGEVYVAFGAERQEFFFGGVSSSLNEESIFGWSVGGGKAIFLNEFMALEPILRVRNIKHTNKEFTDVFRQEFGAEVALAISIFIE